MARRPTTDYSRLTWERPPLICSTSRPFGTRSTAGRGEPGAKIVPVLLLGGPQVRDLGVVLADLDRTLGAVHLQQQPRMRTSSVDQERVARGACGDGEPADHIERLGQQER